MPNLTDITNIKRILSEHGFNFSKALGQNFLINPSVCPKMAECSVAGDNYGVIEIGPGIGVLTAELAKRAKKVVSVELDKRLLPVLSKTLSGFDNVKIINADALKVDFHKLIRDEFDGMNVAICANLPYYITSPIIMSLLESRLPLTSITVMVQKEAAKRISAPVGTRESGAISVAVSYYCEPEIMFNVSRGSFMPAPNVDSTVIRLNIRQKLPIDVSDEKKFFSLVRAAFSQRRKTVVNSVSSCLGIEKAVVIKALEQAMLDKNVRAEELLMVDFKKLYDMIF